MSKTKHKTSVNLEKKNVGLVYYLIKEGKQVNIGDFLNTILDNMMIIYAEEFCMTVEELELESLKAYDLRNKDMTESSYKTLQDLKKAKPVQNPKDKVYTEDNIPAGSLEKNFM